MSTWIGLGNYLARPINIIGIAAPLGQSDLLKASNATVLLFFSRNYKTSAIGREVLQRAIASCPLAITVAGVGAGAAFDDLLSSSTDASDSKHIMTAYLDDASIEDVVESFLFGVFPAEERFDEWHTLAVAVIEDTSTCLAQVRNAITKWIEDDNKETGTAGGQQLS